MSLTKNQYGIPEPSFIKVSVYDINGRLIKVLDEGNKIAGYYTVSWNANNIPSGMYFIRFSTPKYNATRKISLIK